jgi:ABC-type amino acid transport substrate-binding protein
MKTIFFTFFLLLGSLSSSHAAGETAFDRIQRTGTLRCGYVVYAPSIIKDANTGALSGIFYDLTEKMGEKLNLEVEWTEEVNFSTMAEGLKRGRYDLLCLNGWDSAHLASHVVNARPLFYSVINAFVREGDMRFDGRPAALNDPAVKFSAIDGNGTTVIARQTFRERHW